MDEKILIKLPRTKHVEELGKNITLGTFEKHYIANTARSFSDKRNTIRPEELKQPPHRFTKGQDHYLTLDADNLDDYKQLRRLAQIISLKDLGRISTLLGIDRDTVLVEAGSGSGAATCYFARIAKHIHSYEVEDEHLAVAVENAKNLGATNVTFYRKSIYESDEVKTHEADALLLDVPDPARALRSVEKTLRLGGRAVIYTPNLTQAQEVVLQLPPTLLNEGTIELTERQWSIKDRVLRPVMQGLGHTAFLTTIRKLPPEA